MWPLSEPGTGRQPAVVVLQLLRLCGENRGSDVKNRSCLRATGLAANLLRLLHRENIFSQPKRRAHPSNYMAFLRSHVASRLILSSIGTGREGNLLVRGEQLKDRLRCPSHPRRVVRPS